MGKRKKYVLAENPFSGKKLQMSEENRKRREVKNGKRGHSKAVLPIFRRAEWYPVGFHVEDSWCVWKTLPRDFQPPA